MAKQRTRAGSLAIWMNGELVGHWTLTSSGHQLQYDQTWTQSPSGRALSLSLPFTPGNQPLRGEVVRSYFENLLPDRPEIRNRLRDRYRAASAQAFDLLAEVGRDCVGAIQILPDDQLPKDVNTIQGIPLDDDEVEAELEVASGLVVPGLNSRDFRLSLAGAQEKSAFLWHEGRWQRPVGTTPSTHIFKLPLGRIGGLDGASENSLENEWLCGKILAAFGLSIAPANLQQFGQQRVLVVERFDRRRAGKGAWWIRLPVEDFCQVQGLPPERKYQSDGGPGIADLMRVLASSQFAETDRLNFFKTQILFWLLAAPDGHAKNFSIFLGPRGTYWSTPLYDVLSAYPWMTQTRNRLPVQKLKLAMSVRGKNPHYEWNQIHRQHWDAEAKRHGFGADAGAVIGSILDATPAVIAEVLASLPSGFPEQVATSILDGLTATAKRLEGMTDMP